MSIKYSILLAMVMTLADLSAQNCSFTITVPQDITICEPSSVELNGSISGQTLGFNWTSNYGYFNDIDLNPSVFVDKTTTFKLKAFSDPAVNLIVNGNFSAGNTGFNTDYNYMADIPGYTQELWAEGTYSVVANPNWVHTHFAPCSDHTGGGEMMVINGAPTYSEVWCQTVSINPNTTYIFQAFATSVETTSPAVLQFSINGNLLGSPFNLSGGSCNWQEFYEVWESGGNTSAVICITNQNFEPSGNDFAIDDIFFGELCTDEKEFTVTLEEFQVTALPLPYLDCNYPDGTIGVEPTPYSPNYTYEWSTINGTINGDGDSETIDITNVGVYTVTVTSAGGCTNELSVEVDGNFTEPDITISGNLVLDCNNPNTVLTGMSNSNITEYLWTLPDQSNHTNKTLNATQQGTYILQVKGSNGCINTDTVQVVLDKADFNYDVAPSDSLRCNTQQVDIYLDLHSQVDQVSWSGPGIVSQNQDKDTIVVSAPGYYIFELSIGNDCSIKDSVKVEILKPLMQYTLPIPDTITCKLPTVAIYPEILSGINGIEWFNQSMEDTIKVDSAGKYIFTLSDINGCKKTDSIFVVDDLKLPQYNVTIDSIDCINNYGQFEVNFSGLYSFEWSGNGQTSTASDPKFAEEGFYSLIVTGENGCRDTSTYQLPSAKRFPEIDTLITPITCKTPEGSILLSASLPSTFSWTDATGNVGTENEIRSTRGSTYLIEATANNGCKTSIIVQLPVDTIPPQLQPIPGFELTCKDSVYLPTITFDQYAQYQWTGPGLDKNTPLRPLLDLPGTYVLLLSGDNGCSSEQTFTITENKKTPVFDVAWDTLNCARPETTLTFSGDNNLNYFLNGNQAIIPGFTIDQTGIYTVVAVNNLGCKSSKIINVAGSFNYPDIALNPVLLNCYQPQAWLKNTGKDQGVTIHWETSTGAVTTDSILVTKQELIVLSAVNADGCESRDTASIQIDFQQPSVQIEGPDVIKCTENAITLNALTDIGNSYNWYDAAGTNLASSGTIMITQPGDYRLVIMNPKNGCENTASIHISKQPSPESIDYSEVQPLCYGDFGQFVWVGNSGGTAPFTLLLNHQSVSLNQPVEVKPGQYNLLLTDANGCTLEGTVEYIAPADFSVYAGQDTLIKLGQSYVLNGSTSLQQNSISQIEWSPSEGLSCTHCLNPIAQPESDTKYTITIYDENGCIHSDEVLIRVHFEKGYVAPNIFNPNSRSGNHKFVVFPISNSIEILKSLSVYDRWGNLMFTTKDIPAGSIEDGWNGTFQGRDVGPGVYVWIAEIVYKDDSEEVATGDITVIR